MWFRNKYQVSVKTNHVKQDMLMLDPTNVHTRPPVSYVVPDAEKVNFLNHCHKPAYHHTGPLKGKLKEEFKCSEEDDMIFQDYLKTF